MNTSRVMYRNNPSGIPDTYHGTMVISIASQKGGTGKTTTSVTLAAGLARTGKRVLLIDIDSQANSSKVLIPDYLALRKEDTVYVTILERKPLPIRPTSIANLDIVPSHILVSNADLELTTAKDHRDARVKRELDKVKGDYDYVLFDCPPALSWLTLNAFTLPNQADRGQRAAARHGSAWTRISHGGSPPACGSLHCGTANSSADRPAGRPVD